MSQSKQINFFMTHKDLINLLRGVEKEKDIKYAKVGLFDTNHIVTTSPLKEFLDINVPSNDDDLGIKQYLVMDKDVEIMMRKVNQIEGSVKYAIDQSENPKSIVLKTGGEIANNTIIAGSIGTIFENTHDAELFELFKRDMIKCCQKVNSFYVGSEAYAHFKDGYRLTANVNGSSEYDLKEPAQEALI